MKLASQSVPSATANPSADLAASVIRAARVSRPVTRQGSRWFFGLMVLLAMGPLSGCVMNEATGRRQLALISSNQANALGEQAKIEMRDNYGGDVPSPRIQQYVKAIGQRIADQSEMADLPWEFFVVDSAVINAFALPGGKVYMSRGLLQEMTNEAQLAAVMGHEVAHVTAEHTRERMSQAMLVQVGAAALMIGGQVADEDWLSVLGVGASAGGGLYLLKFNRDQEAESDRLGLRYMTNLGYDPQGMVELMQILKAAGGGGGGADIFKTHPNPDLRMRQAGEIIVAQGWDRRTDWTTGENAFRANVLEPLSRLSTPRHTGQQAANTGDQSSPADPIVALSNHALCNH